MIYTKLAAPLIALGLLAGCATGSTTVNLTKAQAQANAAVADIAAVGANLVAQGALNAATEIKVVQDVVAANAAFQAVQNGTQTNAQLAANLANAVRVALVALGGQVPPNVSAVVTAAIAALNAYFSSLSGTPGFVLGVTAPPA
jgi:hypothetical protein